MDGEAAPAASDVEHSLAGPQAQLLADQLELRFLGLLERAGTAREVGAAIGHRPIKEQREELVARVVVVADGAPISVDRVPLAAQAQLGLRRPRGHDDPTGSKQSRAERHPLPRTQPGRPPFVDDPQRGVQVVYVDEPADVGAPEAQLARL